MKGFFCLALAICLSLSSALAGNVDLSTAIRSKLTGSNEAEMLQMTKYEENLDDLLLVFLAKEAKARKESGSSSKTEMQMPYYENHVVPDTITEEDLHIILVVLKLIEEKEMKMGKMKKQDYMIAHETEDFYVSDDYLSPEDEKVLLALFAIRLKEDIKEEEAKKMTKKDFEEMITEEDLKELLLLIGLKEKLMAEKKATKAPITKPPMKDEISEEDLKIILLLLHLKEEKYEEEMKMPVMKEMKEKLSKEEVKIILLLLGLKEKEIEEKEMGMKMKMKEGDKQLTDEDLKILLLLVAIKEAEKEKPVPAKTEKYISDEDLKILLLLAGIKDKEHVVAAKKTIIKKQAKENLIYKLLFLAGLRWNLKFIEQYNITLPENYTQSEWSKAVDASDLARFDDNDDIFKIFFVGGLKYNLNLLDYLNVTLPITEEEAVRLEAIGQTGSLNIAEVRGNDNGAGTHFNFLYHAFMTVACAFVVNFLK